MFNRLFPVFAKVLSALSGDAAAVGATCGGVGLLL